MKEIRLWIVIFFNLFLTVCTLVYSCELKRMNEKLEEKLNYKYELILNAFGQVNDGFAYQGELIKQYKRDCENITSKVINEEW